MTDIAALKRQLADAGLTHGPVHDALDELERTRVERDDAFAKGVAHGQSAMQQITGPLQVVDSPELATLRAHVARLETVQGAAKPFDCECGRVGPCGPGCIAYSRTLAQGEPK
jgi:hypothetical protein